MSPLIRTRWAAIGAAIAVSLGAGGLSIANAAIGSGERAVFVPVTPCRVLDTRPGEAVPGRQTPLGAGETFTQNAHGNNGRCRGIPADATALSLNVTTTNATGGTFVTIWPTGPVRPVASSLNPAPNQPPTPNAVTTDISASGQFNVYNFAGQVDILIDINGYYVDHHHDDRYYSKAQIDWAEGVDAVQDKWISIDPLSVNMRNGAFASWGLGTNAGLTLNDGGSPSFEFGFTIPPDHTQGTPVTAEILWHIDQTGCTVNLRSNFYSVSRQGQVPRGNGFFPVASDPVSGTSNTTVRAVATVPNTGFGLAAGDSAFLGLFRSSTSDTCSQPIKITGIRVLYN
jgi:hypothetical protein